jgi:hypothetical protein
MAVQCQNINLISDHVCLFYFCFLPSSQLSVMPSEIPSSTPSASTNAPSTSPSAIPSAMPSGEPSDSPSALLESQSPSESPSDFPSSAPSGIPTDAPSSAPSESPSDIPSAIPKGGQGDCQYSRMAQCPSYGPHTGFGTSQSRSGRAQTNPSQNVYRRMTTTDTGLGLV